MHELSVAFVWHQHQPYYPDDLSGQNAMPWVRLHGTKEYWGMAMHLAEVPEMRATINLVPSLVAQILAYTEGQATDEHLRVSRMPADSLSEAERLYLLDNFFMANPQQMIRPYTRYWELYQQRGLQVDDAARALRRFSDADLLDLQCWNNLIWFHPIAFEIDDELAEFRRQGGHWTEDQKQWLLDKQLGILAEVIPLHRRLAERGQIELTTTPFYHPILPLLVDKRLARQAMPEVNLPRRLEGYAEDAAAQLRRAVDYHARVFGSKPQGLWPSEGSVAQAIIPMVVDAGIKWMASDEEILARSTEGRTARDARGFVQQPHLLYRPWRVEENGRQLQMIFRDHALSDLIGFQYQRYDAEDAAQDLIDKLEAIGRATSTQASKNGTLVSIILDGENCWEHYPEGGVRFLRTLYRRLADHTHIKPVRVRDHLAQHPAPERLSQLFAGSWISHNFGIWIGHPACNRAWDLLAEAREAIVEQSATGDCKAADLAKAWQELYIAEGSDWFWWFDDQHSSSQDWLFDQLFRRHLQNIYVHLGMEPPAALSAPLSAERHHVRTYTEPAGLLNVRVDGRETYFEWLSAGQYVAAAARGTMNMADRERIEQLYFGFDTERLLVRLDADGRIRQRLTEIDSLRLIFTEPAGYELLIDGPSSARPSAHLYHNDVPVSAAGIVVAADRILEIAIPWRSLSAAIDTPVHFYAELVQDEQPVERVPHEGLIETFVPSPDYELMMWQA